MSFELVVYGPFGAQIDNGDAESIETGSVAMITYDEDMLTRGILGGTLKPGCFNGHRTKPGHVSEWPEQFRGLKTAYDLEADSYNEPWPKPDSAE